MNYRKILLVLISFIFLSSNYAFSQLNYGFESGVNISNSTANTDYNYNSDSRIGLKLDFFIEHPISKSDFSLRSGFIYNQKGTTFSGTYQGSPVEIVDKRDYIDIPIFLKYNFKFSESSYPFLLAGPYIGINVNSETVLTSSGIKQTQINDRTDFGISTGVGYKINILSLNVRYSTGFNKVGVLKGNNSVFSGSISFTL